MKLVLRYTDRVHGPSKRVEKAPELPEWDLFDLRLRLEVLRERAGLAALAWYDEGMPRRAKGNPAGAGGSLGQYHSHVKKIAREIRYRTRGGARG